MRTVIHRFEETASTNDLAAARAREGGEEGEVFVADAQTAGRGRLGRRWESPRGENLYVSVLLKPDVPPARASLLVALFDALDPLLSGGHLKIKWPNDLYWSDRKIAGILSESEAEGGRVRWVVVGAGVNVNADPEDLSDEIRETATSLKMALGRAVDREDVLARFLAALGTRYEAFLERGPSEALEACERHSYLKDKKVRWDGGTGTAVGISPEGFLRVLTESGREQTLAVGDVHLCF
jgi:BirA family biotin operon repressor/biotin-[acetyl-CoA-carboxylase] ligase